MSAASVSRWRMRDATKARSSSVSGRRPSLEGDGKPADTIMAIMASNRDITLAEIKAALAEQKIAASVAGLWSFFRRHGITLKKVAHASDRTAPTS